MPPPSLGTLLCLPQSLGYRLERNLSIWYHSSLGWKKLRGSWKKPQGTFAPTDKEMDSCNVGGLLKGQELLQQGSASSSPKDQGPGGK